MIKTLMIKYNLFRYEREIITCMWRQLPSESLQTIEHKAQQKLQSNLLLEDLSKYPDSSLQERAQRLNTSSQLIQQDIAFYQLQQDKHKLLKLLQKLKNDMKEYPVSSIKERVSRMIIRKYLLVRLINEYIDNYEEKLPELEQYESVAAYNKKIITAAIARTQIQRKKYKRFRDRQKNADKTPSKRLKRGVKRTLHQQQVIAMEQNSNQDA